MTLKFPADFHERLGAEIRRRRIAAGASQSDLASGALGVTFQQLQKYEKGTNHLGLESALRVANYFGVSLPELLAPAITGTQPVDITDRQRGVLELARLGSRVTPAQLKAVSAVLRAMAEPGS